MQIEEQAWYKFKELPPEKKSEVIDFIEWLSSRRTPPEKPIVSLSGLWQHLGEVPTAEDIDISRVEMFKNWPDEDI